MQVLIVLFQAYMRNANKFDQDEVFKRINVITDKLGAPRIEPQINIETKSGLSTSYHHNLKVRYTVQKLLGQWCK